jgi:hypothetical protein
VPPGFALPGGSGMARSGPEGPLMIEIPLSSISSIAVTRIENGADAKQLAGVEFIDENGGGPGVRLRKRHQKKS